MTGWAVAGRGIADGVGLRLAEIETDSPGSGVDVMEIRPTRDLGDIAPLGLTLPEAKQLLGRVQQAVVAAHAHGHAFCGRGSYLGSQTC